MKLHENIQLFHDAILAASQSKEDGGLGIKSIFIEKDYWICRSLSLMVKGDPEHKAVFKGGTRRMVSVPGSLKILILPLLKHGR